VLNCNPNKSIISYFKEFDILKPESVLPLNDLYFKFARISELNDSTLIITARSISHTSGNSLIYFISKNTGSIIREIGPSGRGPAELMGVFSTSILKNEIIFYDPISYKILKYNFIRDSSNYQSFKIKKEYIIDYLSVIDSNKYILLGLFKGKMFNYLNLETGEEFVNIDYPKLQNQQDADSKKTGFLSYSAFPGSLIKRPEHSSFAFYSSTSELIQIIEVIGNMIIGKKQILYDLPVGNIVFNQDAFIWGYNNKSKYCFIDGTASEKYLYLLYSGNYIRDKNSILSNCILVFDWNGNKIKKIDLDRKVFAISVDSKDQELYAFSLNENTFKNELLHYLLSANY
jgi:hypothetical protein